MPAAQASWLIDAEGFHVSVHGLISCRECHGDISERRPHPNPENVNKTLRDFFRAERCTDCHVEVFDEVHAGTHGGGTGKAREELEYCIGCHDPHYQMLSATREATIDLSGPAEAKCGTCHEYRDLLPRLSEEDEGCMGCHRRRSADDPEAEERLAGLCFHCHGKPPEGDAAEPGSEFPRIDASEYPASTHSRVTCLECHSGSVQYGHADQVLGDCLPCHVRHDEKVAHDAHLRVSCQACHLRDVTPVLDADSGQVLWRTDPGPGNVSRVHHMLRGREPGACKRCHFKGNSLGVAAMVLPAKSVMCMPCHPATFSVSDAPTFVAVLVFLFGFISLGSVWVSGGYGAARGASAWQEVLRRLRGAIGALFSTRLFSIMKTLLLDGLLQRRLFRQSKTRWAIHALIFHPLVFRFSWGLLGFVSSLYLPHRTWTWILLDKNHPLTAFLFDLTGVMMASGILCVLVRRAKRRREGGLQDLPGPDWTSLGLFVCILLVGFFLEGMRISMTGNPAGSGCAFLGYGISRFLTRFDLTAVYGYVWYVHSILTGAFVAYLPFSRMFHMIMAPISLALNAGSPHGAGRR